MPAMVLMDCVMRYIPDVLSNEDSAKTESFDDGLLEYPQYTRPQEYEGMSVPEVLVSGNHAQIERWQRIEALRRTWQRRPELLEKAGLGGEDEELLEKIKLGRI